MLAVNLLMHKTFNFLRGVWCSARSYKLFFKVTIDGELGRQRRMLRKAELFNFRRGVWCSTRSYKLFFKDTVDGELGRLR
jgi:hypothetical protein